MVKSVHNYIELPFISKSTLSCYEFCPFLFYKNYIQGVSAKPKTSAKVGTYLHEIYDSFYDRLDFDKLWNLEWRRMSKEGTTCNKEFTPAWIYLKDVFFSFFKDDERDDAKKTEWVIRQMRGFVTFNYDVWFNLRTHLQSKKEIIKYFAPTPSQRERTLVDKEWKIYGTYDRIFEDIDPYRIIILDYKTGKVPKGVREGKTNKDGAYTAGLNASKRLEGTFYCILYLLKNGYNFRKIDDGKGKKRYYIIDRNGERVSLNFIEYGYLFTKGNKRNPYYFVKKKLNIRSIRSVIRKIKELRSKFKVGKNGEIIPLVEFERNNTMWTCKNCFSRDVFCKDLKFGEKNGDFKSEIR